MRDLINLIERAELEESSASRILQHIRDGVEFFMISAMRSNLNHPENVRRSHKLRHLLNALPVSYIATEGEYHETGAAAPSREVSYFVMAYNKEGSVPFDYLRRIGVKLMHKFEQDAIILGDGEDVMMIENDGTEFGIGNHMTFDPVRIASLPGFSQVKGHKFSFSAEPTGLSYGSISG